MNENTTYQSYQAQYGRLFSISLPCEGVTLADFLRHAFGNPRFYWESSRDDVAFAGMGIALELMAWGEDRFDKIHHHALELFAEALIDAGDEPLSAPRLFGGFAFRDDFVPDVTWSDFTPAHFVLPHFQLVRVRDKTYLTINAHVPYGENPHALRDDLLTALRARIAWLQDESSVPPTPQPQLRELDYPLSAQDWARGIHDAQAKMRVGELRKVVLSRVVEARFDSPIDVDSALATLANTYPETYRFLFEPRAHHAFYGATPELLVQSEGRSVKTMALAGSAKRGATPNEDSALARQLLQDPKERYEHGVVVENITARLQPLCSALNVGEVGIYALSNIQHLHTPISGTLKHNDGVVPLVAALHPTPALGGEPREVALAVIGACEPVTRGWFGAPIGWIDHKLDGQFGVAIRSAITRAGRVWLYAGAGIVPDSQPEREWAETALKLRPMFEALHITEQVCHEQP